jgi:hypothetical protein
MMHFEMLSKNYEAVKKTDLGGSEQNFALRLVEVARLLGNFMCLFSLTYGLWNFHVFSIIDC